MSPRLSWEGSVTSVQPRIRLLRSFDQRQHEYLGYVLRLEGSVDRVPTAIVAHSWRAQKRLHKKFEALAYRMAPTKAVVAVARELVGFVWALLHNDPGLLQPRVR